MIDIVNELYKWLVKFYNEESSFTVKLREPLIGILDKLQVKYDPKIKDYKHDPLEPKIIEFKFKIEDEMTEEMMIKIAKEVLRVGLEIKKFINEKLLTIQHDVKMVKLPDSASAVLPLAIMPSTEQQLAIMPSTEQQLAIMPSTEQQLAIMPSTDITRL